MKVKKIKKGQIWRIHPSMSFLGITEGIVEVVAVTTHNDQRIKETYDDWVFQYVGEKTPEQYDDFDRECVEELKQPWIIYRYTESNHNMNNDMIGKKFHFPLSYFVQHVTIY